MWLKAALDAATHASQASSLGELECVIAVAVRALGFEHIGGVDIVPALDRGHSVTHAFGVTATGWLAECRNQGLADADPVHDEATRTSEPFFWSELQTRRGGLALRERQVLQRARVFGLREVLTIPEHRPGWATGAIHLVGRGAEAPDPPRRAAAYLVAVYYANAARRLATRRNPGTLPQILSQRQLECLKWVRQGKSAADIAAILDLSRRTVEDHIAAACSRLGVRTRIQAVSAAIVRGLLIGAAVLIEPVELIDGLVWPVNLSAVAGTIVG